MDQPGMTLLLETDQISVKPQTHIRFAQNFTFEKKRAKKWCFCIKASYIMYGVFLTYFWNSLLKKVQETNSIVLLCLKALCFMVERTSSNLPPSFSKVRNISCGKNVAWSNLPWPQYMIQKGTIIQLLKKLSWLLRSFILVSVTENNIS